MAEIPRIQLMVGAVLGVAALAFGVQALGASGGGPSAASGRSSPAGAATRVAVERAPAARVLVHVAGAVDAPGVYALEDGDRVKDAVRRAGGTTASGDRDAINLAAKVADGQQVVVPERAPATGRAVASTDGAGGEAASPAAPVGLNSADATQLQTLDGVGPATAEKIIAWRTEHNGFRSVDDLAQVPGIGPKKLAALKPHVQP